MTDAPGPGAGGIRDYYDVEFHFHGNEPPPDVMSSRNTPPRQVADEQLSRLQRRFARPMGINDAYDTLERHNIVFLYGTPGNGRTTAARVLLRELPRGSGVYHELTPDADDQSAEPLTPELIGEGDRMLLDLSDAEEDVWTQCHNRFPGFHKILLDKRSFLAVVLPPAHADRLSPDFAAYRRVVNRPDDLEVIARHLRLRGVDPGDSGQAPKELTDYLSDKPPMRELAYLAGIIVDARRTAKPEESFADWCRQAIAAAEEEEDDFVPPLHNGPQRALLLSVAMLHGAPADLVHRAAAILRRSLRIAGDDRPLLEHESLTERLREVGASRNDEARVHFDKLRHDHAVRRFFWRNMPDLRRPLRDWVEQVLALPQFPEEGRKDLVVRLAALCALTEDADRLAEPARDWALRYDDPARLRAAAEWLGWGVRNEDERTSRHFRHAIYTWAIRPAEPNLRRVLVDVCVNVMAFTHPEQAVVRLHHLARREPLDEGSGKNAARHVLLRLVEMDTRLRRYLLFRLALAPPRRNGRQQAVDAWLFLGLLTMPSRPEHALLQSPSARLWLLMCWSDVLRSFSSRSWLPHLQRWITTTDAADDPELVHLALDVLVDAAAENYPALRQIYLTARKSLSAEKTERLLSRIEEAQHRRPPLRADPGKGIRT
ncbi:hypothetical protein [Streptomyces sp. SLBN-31]|uniref:hypothetical protein n=1 Tax=Streptomyces sp. SLBN-31 TaxID=2768444 RepID=UPI00114DB6A0|nr:hypothetical protein [Streptomyces sp. SLBN-31]TQJ86732.1 hypothetical protein FBY22_5556 [Streptomyces sp. SLBN-31]